MSKNNFITPKELLNKIELNAPKDIVECEGKILCIKKRIKLLNPCGMPEYPFPELDTYKPIVIRTGSMFGGEVSEDHLMKEVLDDDLALDFEIEWVYVWLTRLQLRQLDLEKKVEEWRYSY